MAEKEIIQNEIGRLGQSQGDRAPRELDPGFAPIDGRTPSEHYALLRRLAEHLQFYSGDPSVATGTWHSYLPADDDATMLSRTDGNVAPHLGLLATFLKLFENTRGAMNRLTAQHMDFQFRRVLGFRPSPANPDRAHVVLELKKGASPIVVTTSHEFSAGKDDTKIERIYKPVRDVVIGKGQVADLRSVYRGGDDVRRAPIANSSDGLGGALNAAQPMWRAFGHAGLPKAQPGFAVASPTLAMAEGERRLTLELNLDGLDPSVHSASALAGSFEAFCTGPKGWLGPFALEGSLAEQRLTLRTTIGSDELGLVAYDPAIHGQSYATTDPVLHLQLRTDSALSYADLATLNATSVRVTVNVTGVKSLQLENDTGSLDPKRAFLPFGAQPVSGSRFMVGCPEALSKSLRSLSVSLTWQGAPDDLAAWYANYKNVSRVANGVSVRVAFEDRAGQKKISTHDCMKRTDGVTTITPTAPSVPSSGASSGFVGASSASKTANTIYAFSASGSSMAAGIATQLMLTYPLYTRAALAAPETRSGFIAFELTESFLHRDYRTETIEHAVNQDKTVLNEPYTPCVQSISLDYEAQSDEVNLSDTSSASFANRDVQFFHIGCFGQMREHAYLRSAAGFLGDTQVTLLPSYRHEGEFLVGLTGIGAGDSISVLVQVADGSADPERTPQELQWWVLCDNYWHLLSTDEFTLDTTSDLRSSGLLAFTLPRDTTTDHTILPSGLVWLRATIAEQSTAACQLIALHANGVEVRFNDRGNDPSHLALPLAAGSITKLKAAAREVKSIVQPYASVGGRMTETDDALRIRAAERLRHRARCVTAWDYERMVLDAFPEIHRVKCIPHARDGSWLAPGHVLIVVIPDLRNLNAVDPLQPRADIATLTAIRAYVEARCGMRPSITVRNPFYQRVTLELGVAMRAGFSFNCYSGQLNQALKAALAPWAYDSSRRIEFGGVAYRSVLLDLVEELPYVDYVTDVRMTTTLGDGSTSGDLSMVAAATPDAILVSSDSHVITQVK